MTILPSKNGGRGCEVVCTCHRLISPKGTQIFCECSQRLKGRSSSTEFTIAQPRKRSGLGLDYQEGASPSGRKERSVVPCKTRAIGGIFPSVKTLAIAGLSVSSA